MYKTIFHTIVYCLLYCCTTFSFAHADEAKKTAAIMAAENFLILVDTGQYGQSWDTAANFFKSRVIKETWINQIEGIRPHLGKVAKRKIQSAHYLTQLPGAPDGEYVVIQYETSFEKKKNSIETITPMLDKDGKWRVSGYFIK